MYGLSLVLSFFLLSLLTVGVRSQSLTCTCSISASTGTARVNYYWSGFSEYHKSNPWLAVYDSSSRKCCFSKCFYPETDYFPPHDGHLDESGFNTFVVQGLQFYHTYTCVAWEKESWDCTKIESSNTFRCSIDTSSGMTTTTTTTTTTTPSPLSPFHSPSSNSHIVKSELPSNTMVIVMSVSGAFFVLMFAFLVIVIKIRRAKIRQQQQQQQEEGEGLMDRKDDQTNDSSSSSSSRGKYAPVMQNEVGAPMGTANTDSFNIPLSPVYVATNVHH